MRAQVRVDPDALNSLSAAPPAPDAPAKAAPRQRRAVNHKPARPAPAHHPAPQAANKPAAPAAPVTIAPAAPPPATLAPLATAPAPRPLPAPIIPMMPDAAGDASAIAGGVRVTFGPGKFDMSPSTVDALHRFGQAVAPNPSADVNVYAYAAGAPDDPSTPRRLSLSRALAARAVLMSDNIGSTRIYVHALGSTPSDGPPDRVDVQLAGTPQKTPPPAPPPGPQAAAPRTP